MQNPTWNKFTGKSDIKILERERERERERETDCRIHNRHTLPSKQRSQVSSNKSMKENIQNTGATYFSKFGSTACRYYIFFGFRLTESAKRRVYV